MQGHSSEAGAVAVGAVSRRGGELALRNIPAIETDNEPKLTIKRESLRSPVASCTNPVTSGPRAVPMELIIMMNAMPIANSLGLTPGKWNGTE